MEKNQKKRIKISHFVRDFQRESFTTWCKTVFFFVFFGKMLEEQYCCSTYHCKERQFLVPYPNERLLEEEERKKREKTHCYACQDIKNGRKL